MYQTDKLKEYVCSTQVISISNNLKIRLSNDLLNKYNSGLYNNALNQILDYIKQINDLGIKYPGNAQPVFYIYVVPDENFRELLKFSNYENYKGGGKSVIAYELDSYNAAYGVSNNMLENRKDYSISQTVNSIHEFAHLVHSMFFINRDQLLSEGFAEALPLYTMDYESIYDEHREMLETLTEDQILSAQQLIELSENNHFNAGAVSPTKSCSFDYSYISSYLFVRGCMEAIASRYNLDRIQSTQKFLEIVKQSSCSHQWLIFDIANTTGIPQEDLLNGKNMQLNVIKGLKDSKKR